MYTYIHIYIQGTDWTSLKKLVKQEAKKGNPIAQIIHQLKLESNQVNQHPTGFSHALFFYMETCAKALTYSSGFSEFLVQCAVMSIWCAHVGSTRNPVVRLGQR